jgi:tetratricopeptide (TPR) repeat protein
MPHPRHKSRSRKPGSTPPAWPLALWVGPLLVLLAFILYGNTLGHGYVLDDILVIANNQFTQQGWKGIPSILAHDSFVGFYGAHKSLVQGGRYRPLSIVTFAIEQQFFHGNPHVSHAVNVLLYGLTCWSLFVVLRRLLRRPANPTWSVGVPLTATLLFLVHPVHTEVVANIKGRDEILALLLALVSQMLQLRYLERRKPIWLVGAGVSFFLALLSKESALPLLVVFPLALWFFTSASRSDQVRLFLACLAGTAAYLALRQVATGGVAIRGTPEVLNDPFLFATISQRYATIFDTLLRYLRLLLVPHPLSHDYYFNQVPIVGWNHPASILSLGLHLALLGVALLGTQRKDPIAFGILFYLLALSVSSNLVVTVGVILSERFLYIPSVGAALVAAFGFEWLARRLAPARQTRLVMAAFLATLVVFAVLTVRRNPAWHDNLTLFQTDVRTSSNSAKLRTSLGGTLIDIALASGDSTEGRRLLDDGIGHLRKAVEIYPAYGQPWLLLGNVYATSPSTWPTAIDCYRRAIAGWPGFVAAYNNLSILLRQEQDYAGAAMTSRTLLARDSTNAKAWYQLGLTFEAWDKPDSALGAYEKAVRADTNLGAALAKLGVAYGRSRADWHTAERRLAEAIRKGERGEWVFDNLAVALDSLGRYQEAIDVLDEGLRYHPGSQTLENGLATTYHLMGDEQRAREHEAKAGPPQGGVP